MADTATPTVNITDLIYIYNNKGVIMSKLFDVLCLVVHEGKVYERMSNHTHKYRVIFSDDDYDYVEDESLIEVLDVLNTL